MSAMKLALCLLGLNLLALPCYADVIPTQYDDRDPQACLVVSERLQDLGLDAVAADSRVQSMDAGQLAYWAQDGRRIQPAGKLYWYEWAGGLAFLSFFGWIYLVAVSD